MNSLSLVRMGFSVLLLIGLWLSYEGWIADRPGSWEKPDTFAAEPRE
jgi:hypothetical protein